MSRSKRRMTRSPRFTAQVAEYSGNHSGATTFEAVCWRRGLGCMMCWLVRPRWPRRFFATWRIMVDLIPVLRAALASSRCWRQRPIAKRSSPTCSLRGRIITITSPSIVRPRKVCSRSTPCAPQTTCSFPVELSPFAVDGVARLQDTVMVLGDRYDITIKVSLLPSMVDRRSHLGQQLLANCVGDMWPDQLAAVGIRHSVKEREAALRSTLDRLRAPAAVMADFAALAEAMMGHPVDRDSRAPRHAAVLQRVPNLNFSESIDSTKKAATSC